MPTTLPTRDARLRRPLTTEAAQRILRDIATLAARTPTEAGYWMALAERLGGGRG